MSLLQLAAHPREEIMRIDLDAVQLDPQRARLAIHNDAAGRMQRVLVSGSRVTGPGLCHQLISVIIPEPVRHSCDDFALELLDCVIRAGTVVDASPTTPPGVSRWTRRCDGDIAERRLTHSRRAENDGPDSEAREGRSNGR